MREVTMRTLILATAAVLASATAALATPASVSVSIGPKLQTKAEETLGVREVDDLAKTLQATVEKKLAKTSAYDGARIELVLTDATPNHPTFKQLSDKPGLSMRSFGIGGAAIEGRAVSPDGKVIPLHYSYTEPDIRWSQRGGIWTDAEDTFDQFAYELSRGKAPSEH
jgi:hypothetical protein